MEERYGTIIGGIEWEIDLVARVMICAEDPKIVRRLSRKEVSHLRNMIKNKQNRGRN